MAINTRQFGEELKQLGYQFYSGVPCSFLKDLINYAINDLCYVAAANEGDAVAIASGAYLGGVKSVALMQNSGLTNAISPLTSLNFPFRLPILGFVSLRGEEGLNDEPQHELMGQITLELLETMRIPHEILADNMEKAREQLKKANALIEKNETFFFVVRHGTFEKEPLKKNVIPSVRNMRKVLQSRASALPSRLESLETMNAWKDQDMIVLATTGVTGRELYEIEDAKNNLYMVGSMGCVSSFGLGLSLVRPDKKVVVIDGDGSLLMRMGSLATNAAYGADNLLHVLLDNGIHDSTGGQDTVSGNVNFVEVAASCGYKNALFAHDLKELEGFLREWKQNPSLTFLHLKIRKGTKENLGRPKTKPFEIKNRLMFFIGNHGERKE
jgi:phosphonopyruvate decarboxylase